MFISEAKPRFGLKTNNEAIYSYVNVPTFRSAKTTFNRVVTTAPTHPAQPLNSGDDEDIYILPDPVATSSASGKRDSTCNLTSIIIDSLPSSLGSKTTLLVTPNNKTVQPSTGKNPTPSTKPYS